MITLYHFGDVWGLDPSPFCLKLETYLGLAGLPYVKRPGDPLRAPKGKLPYIEDDGRRIADSHFIIEYLKGRYGDPLDAALSLRQQAEGQAIRRMLEDGLYWVLLYSRWIDPVGWQVWKPTFATLLPPPARPFLPTVIRRLVRRQIHAQGTLRHARGDIYALGRRDLDALSVLLGDRPFLAGDGVSSIDAVAYGFLVNIMDAPIDSPLKSAALGHGNLVALCGRVRRAAA